MRFSPEKDWGANAGLGKARALVELLPAYHRHMLDSPDSLLLRCAAARVRCLLCAVCCVCACVRLLPAC